MATDNRVLIFQCEEITREKALELLKGTYGEQRPAEILAGLASGKYLCASVAGGHIQLVPKIETPAEAPAPAAEAPAPEATATAVEQTAPPTPGT